jgi:GDP-L-fucose synthase
MKKVLITGSSGFLGKNLTRILEQKGVAVTGLTSKIADLTDCKSLDKFPGDNYDHIFHLAVWTQAGDFCAKRGGEQWIINQQINTNVLNWWMQKAPQAKMIAFGTSVSYSVEEDLSEPKYLDGQPNEKFYAYAMSKRMLLAGLQCLSKQFGMDYLYVIPSTLYGPGYHTDDRQLHFIYDLIRKIMRGKLYGEPVTLWGDGMQRRELVYIDDFVNDLLALNEVAKNDIFNLGGGMDHSIRDFAAAICKIAGYDADKIGYDVGQYVGARSKILEVGKLRATIGSNRAHTSLEEGIKKTISWFEENNDVFLAPDNKKQ